MIKRYKCIKLFELDMYTEDGFSTEDTITVNKGNIYEFDTENSYRIVGGDVHLDLVEDYTGNKDVHGWIEIANKTLKEYFEEVAIND